jgi:hypothetical protein
MTARHTLAHPHALTDAQLRAELSLAIAAHHYPRHAYAQRTISNAAHVRQVNPQPADPGVGGELLRMEG